LGFFESFIIGFRVQVALPNTGIYTIIIPKQKMRNISGTLEHAPLVSFGPSHYIIIHLNKP
jgi:hypothetical protein